MIALMEATDETYREVERLIRRTVLRFHNCYGGELDEQQSIANLAFMEAVRKHDPEKGAFTTILVRLIWCRLMKDLKKLIDRGRARPTILRWWSRRRESLSFIVVDFDLPSSPDLNQLEARPDRSPFDINRFSENATEDAQQVLSIALEFGSELRREVRGRKKTLREMLREALQNLGWTVDRITESFAEIRSALG